MSSPEQIQQEIERTRASLSSDVDRLNEKISPSAVVGRRVDKIKGSATTVKDRVMGSPDDGGGLRGMSGTATSGVSSARDSMSSAASSVSDVASAAPQHVRRQTQGNPMAAGIIAFGVGMLLSSLAPVTDKEREIAKAAEDKATDLAQPLKEKAQEVAGNLQQPLQDSVEKVKSTATDGANATAEQARSAAASVKEPLQQ